MEGGRDTKAAAAANNKRTTGQKESKSKKVVARACNFCRAAHISCETARPCQRCVRLGRGEWCCDVPANKRGRPPIHGRRSAQYQQELKRQKLAGLKEEADDEDYDHHPREQGDDSAVVCPPATVPSTAATLPASSAYAHASESPTDLRHHQPPPSSSPSPPPPPPPERPFFHATNSLLNAFFSNFATTTTTTSPQASPLQPTSPSPLQPTSPPRPAVNQLGVVSDGQCLLPGGSSCDPRVEQLTALTRQLTAEISLLREANESLHRTNAALHERLAEVEARQAAQSRRVQTLFELQESAPPQLAMDNAMGDAFRLTGWESHQAGTTLVQPARAIEIEDKQTWCNLLFSPSSALPASRSSSASSSSSIEHSSAESLPTSPRSSFSLERSVLQSSLVASKQALDEMQQHIPHLRLYYVAPKDFAVQDMRYPVYVLTPPAGGTCVSPVVKWVNEAFVSLSGYTRDKLIGMPLPRLFSSQKSQTAMLAACIFNQAPMSASGTFGLHPLLRQRNGCTVRIDELNQFFYGQHGAVVFSVTCILGWQADTLRPDEQFGQWLPELLRIKGS